MEILKANINKLSKLDSKFPVDLIKTVDEDS
jgi:hypothetical protein